MEPPHVKLRTRAAMISAIHAKKNLSFGAYEFLVQLVTKNVEKRLVEDILMVVKSPKVLIDDLSGLPLIQKITFGINLDPGVAPMHKALYQITPSK